MKKYLTAFVLSSFMIASHVSALDIACDAFESTRPIRPSMVNKDVFALQQVLNLDPETQIAESGLGSPGNETQKYGYGTFLAVKKFQEKYASEVLYPGGLKAGTGLVGPATRKKFLALCKAQGGVVDSAVDTNGQQSASVPAPFVPSSPVSSASQPASSASIAPSSCSFLLSSDVIKPNSTNRNLITVQKILNLDSETQVAQSGSGSPGNETSLFGPSTMLAIKRFQEKYAAEVLTPFGLSKGTGLLGGATKRKLYAMCINQANTTTSPVTDGAVVSSLPFTPAAPSSNQGNQQNQSMSTPSSPSQAAQTTSAPVVITNSAAQAAAAAAQITVTSSSLDDAVCGFAHNQLSNIAPSSDLCLAGTPSTISGAGPWTWKCNGRNGGQSASCSAFKSTAPLLDTIKPSVVIEKPSTNSSVSIGSTIDFEVTATDNKSVSGVELYINNSLTNTLVQPTTGSLYKFSIPTMNYSAGTYTISATARDTGGNSTTESIAVTLVTPQTPINASCGVSNNLSFLRTPSFGLCAQGTESSVTGGGPWSWSCVGSSGGTSASCSALKAVLKTPVVPDADTTLTTGGDTALTYKTNTTVEPCNTCSGD